MHKTKSIFKKLFLILCLGALLPLSAPSATAVSGGGVSVFPAATADYPGTRSWFVYEAEGGTTIEDKVEVINNTNKTQTLAVAVLDGAVTGSGGYTLVGSKEQNKDIGTWANLEEEEVTLLPKTSRIIDFTVEVPENADVGSHPGGVVVWRKAEATANTGGGQLSVVTRVAARMYLTVPGEIQRILNVKKIEHQFIGGVLHFKLTLENQGNVQLEPVADIRLRGIWGSLGEQKGVHFGLVLRNTTITARSPWQREAPKFGRYVANFRIHYGEKDFKGQYVKDEYVDARYVFWVMPWWQIIIVIAVLLALIFTRNLWLWLVIQQRLNIKTKKHKVKKGETLTQVAAEHDVNPKKIAKFNLLKWPYDLSEGDVLLIPMGRMSKEERMAAREEPKGLKAGGKLESVVVEPGDKLKDVAEFAGISVQEVIALNHLRWPYRVRPGKELLVPAQAEEKPKPKKKRTRRKTKSKKTASSAKKKSSSTKKSKSSTKKTTRKTKKSRKKK